MRTGSFRTCAKLTGAVAISRDVPKFYHGPCYQQVAPKRTMLRMAREDYDRHFERILAGLDPHQVYTDILHRGGENAILLCWEIPNTWCHRRWVAEWLEAALGIEIPEYGFKREALLPYAHLTAIPPDPQLVLF